MIEDEDVLERPIISNAHAQLEARAPDPQDEPELHPADAELDESRIVPLEDCDSDLESDLLPGAATPYLSGMDVPPTADRGGILDRLRTTLSTPSIARIVFSPKPAVYAELLSLSATEQRVAALRRSAAQKGEALFVAKADKRPSAEDIEDLQRTFAELTSELRLYNVQNHVHADLRKGIAASNITRKWFEEHVPGGDHAVVMSVDVRRSTELMLKARTPQDFAAFVTLLCNRLKEVILGNYGMFDKFTGDGILSFFPAFYSGEDAMHWALRAAAECHKVFQDHYLASRGRFTAVLKDTGLGIGIDAGSVHLVTIGEDITAVGIPVVYACRMSGASAGVTLLNQPARELVAERCAAVCNVVETQIDIKHEGATVAYAVTLTDFESCPRKPDWPSG